ncbi:MAG TPA: alpha/beta hydrolase family protein [Urbifossiella sp.]|nr:alpha/beta hydrolase family protein [Urbifossiella sp.]
MSRRTGPLLALAAAIASAPAAGADYLTFVRSQAARHRAADRPPTSPAAWAEQAAKLRADLLAAWGGFPAEKCPLDPQDHGELKRDGYVVKKVSFQTLPGVRVPANLYLPAGGGKRAALLMVHGHWKGAKQDPVVQARCIGAAKLGFVVLCVDAFGAGERAGGTALGEYHGDTTAATLLPVGRPLSGIQVYENMRAVDYLQTRPEVDADKIGITGASGGGNQTMYAGAYDERFKAVVPVCSVGNYQAYLGAACCLCEVVPGALTFTEEGAVLGLVAPRALLVINATRDAPQFSVDEARKSLAYARPVFDLFRKGGSVRHAVFDSGHDYSKAMREEMYGWMALHLKGEGDGAPIPEPALQTEDPEALRCWPGDTRPKDYATIPRFAAAEAKKLLAAMAPPGGQVNWRAWADGRRKALVEKTLGGFPKGGGIQTFNSTGDPLLPFVTEPGVMAHLKGVQLPADPARVIVVVGLDGWQAAYDSPLVKGLRDANTRIEILEPRTTGRGKLTDDRVGRSPDHNSAEWAMWVGRPLLGQWAYDVKRLLDMYEEVKNLPAEVVVVGEGPAGLVALAAAATDPRITRVAAVGSLASFVSDVPYTGQRLGVFAPGILRDVGDVAHLAALAAPRRVVIAGGVNGGGDRLTGDQLRAAYRPAQAAWDVLGAGKQLVIEDSPDAMKVAAALR